MSGPFIEFNLTEFNLNFIFVYKFLQIINMGPSEFHIIADKSGHVFIATKFSKLIKILKKF